MFRKLQAGWSEQRGDIEMIVARFGRISDLIVVQRPSSSSVQGQRCFDAAVFEPLPHVKFTPDQLEDGLVGRLQQRTERIFGDRRRFGRQFLEDEVKEPESLVSRARAGGGQAMVNAPSDQVSSPRAVSAG